LPDYHKEILPFSPFDGLNFGFENSSKMIFVTETAKNPSEPVDSGPQTFSNGIGLLHHNFSLHKIEIF
jgi:hypothetical protein